MRTIIATVHDSMRGINRQVGVGWPHRGQTPHGILHTPRKQTVYSGVMTLVGPNSASTSRAWGELTTPHAREEVLLAMRALSKAGKLAGLSEAKATKSRNGEGGEGELFRVSAFAAPYDRELIAYACADASAQTHLKFVPKVLWGIPIMMIVLSVLSVWPGVWLTDSMIRTYFTSYDYNTSLWYIPLTVLSLVWFAVTSTRKSSREARQSAQEAMEKVQAALPGSVLTSHIAATLAQPSSQASEAEASANQPSVNQPKAQAVPHE